MALNKFEKNFVVFAGFGLFFATGFTGCSQQPVSENAQQQVITQELGRDATGQGWICADERMVVDGDELSAGERVANSAQMYRQFVCQTQERYALVQDFYVNGSKRTDPYALVSSTEIRVPVFDITTYAINERGIEGQYVQWHLNGEKALEACFSNGVFQGAFRRWADNGQKILEEAFIDGKATGTKEVWYSNGYKGQEVLTLEDGYTNVVQGWWEDGSKRYEGRMYNGRRQGMWQGWWPGEQLRIQGRYVAGAREGYWQWWHENGQKRAQGSYHNGKPVGQWQYWDAQGQPDGVERFALIALSPERYFASIKANDGIEIDSQATAAYPLSVGEEIRLYEDGAAMESSMFTRRFIGVSLIQNGSGQAERFYVVQDYFLDGDRKRSSVFMLSDEEDLNRLINTQDDVKACSVEGRYIQWNSNGEKGFQAQMHNGVLTAQ